LSDVIYTTGISGFIGRNLLQTLLKKYNFVLNFERNNKISIHSKNTEKILKDYDLKILKDYSSEILIHLATLYNPNPKDEFEENEILESNLNFPIQVCETLKEINLKKLITTSSYMQLIPEDEQNLYAKSKKDFVKWAKQSLDITEIFLFDSFGPDDNREKVIDIFIKKSLLNEEINIPERKIQINLTHISEISKCIIASLNLQKGKYMILSDNQTTIKDLAEKIVRLLGSKSEIVKGFDAINYFQKISKFPENIYKPSSTEDFESMLLSKSNEIRKTHSF
tara:strand:+ start:213 stop:1055 length:843 start_codon:yes stop_codon:yes gene_type:complete